MARRKKVQWNKLLMGLSFIPYIILIILLLLTMYNVFDYNILLTKGYYLILAVYTCCIISLIYQFWRTLMEFKLNGRVHKIFLCVSLLVILSILIYGLIFAKDSLISILFIMELIPLIPLSVFFLIYYACRKIKLEDKLTFIIPTTLTTILTTIIFIIHK